jgi:hypothetical protein
MTSELDVGDEYRRAADEFSRVVAETCRDMTSFVTAMRQTSTALHPGGHMRLTPLQREYLTILAGQPEGWFTAAEAARKCLMPTPTHTLAHIPRFMVRLEARCARGVLHRLANRGLVNRSPVGRPPGVGELRFRIRTAGINALGAS